MGCFSVSISSTRKPQPGKSCLEPFRRAPAVAGVLRQRAHAGDAEPVVEIRQQPVLLARYKSIECGHSQKTYRAVPSSRYPDGPSRRNAGAYLLPTCASPPPSPSSAPIPKNRISPRRAGWRATAGWTRRSRSIATSWSSGPASRPAGSSCSTCYAARAARGRAGVRGPGGPALRPRRGDALALKGAALSELGRTREAVAALEAALREGRQSRPRLARASLRRLSRR